MSDKITELVKIDRLAKVCTRCNLCNARTRVVFGAGNVNCYVMIVGEAPGDEEDQSGLPFVGRSGQKLNEVLAVLGYPREHLFITNAIKCRPPNNTKPSAAEIALCNPYLMDQIRVIQPKVIIALGGSAFQAVTGTGGKITQIRGRWLQTKGGVLVMPTFHPAHVLRNNTPETNATFLTDFTNAFKRAYNM